MGLTTAQIIALTKGIKGHDSSLHHNHDEATEHSGSVAVIVDYSFKVSPNEMYTPTVHTPLKAVLALLTEESPEMAQLVALKMNEALNLQINAKTGDSDAEARLKGLLKNAPTASANVSDMLGKLPKFERKGKIHAVQTEVLALDVGEVKTALEAKEALENIAKKLNVAQSSKDDEVSEAV